jgi:hypothetical protein
MPTSPKKIGPLESMHACMLAHLIGCQEFLCLHAVCFTIFDLVWNHEHEMWGHCVTKVIKNSSL